MIVIPGLITVLNQGLSAMLTMLTVDEGRSFFVTIFCRDIFGGVFIVLLFAILCLNTHTHTFSARTLSY